MASVKDGYGVYEWCDYKALAVVLQDGASSENAEFVRLLSNSLGLDLIETAPFCAAAQPTPVTIDEADMLSGDWKVKLKQQLQALFYYQICEE